MNSAGQTSITDGFTLAGGRAALAAGLAGAEGVLATARDRLGAALGEAGTQALDAHQFAAHGLAWMATNVEALRQTLAWVDRLEAGFGIHTLAGGKSCIDQGRGILQADFEGARVKSIAPEGVDFLLGPSSEMHLPLEANKELTLPAMGELRVTRLEKGNE